MVVIMSSSATRTEIEAVLERLRSLGFTVQVSCHGGQCIILALGERMPDGRGVEALPGVERTMPVSRPYTLVSREVRPEGTVVWAAGRAIGGHAVTVMAGPCSVESEEQLLVTAQAVRAAGAHFLRGGAYKPRTSPYSWQGLGEEGLRLLQSAKNATGLGVITEVLDPRQIDLVGKVADILQVGSRNMHNYELLKALGQAGLPVLLKRGMAATVEEWLLAAEYIVAAGNPNVILCERGIRTFETYTRNTLDISAVPLVKRLSNLPVIVDPSHSGGKWWLVPALSQAALAAGADGLLVEVHPQPDLALCDGKQSLSPENFAQLMTKLRRAAAAVERTLE
ncbi:MAG: 3-deoxy-7-phosphoheptulonate synthase [Bacillota bacterium]|jgi:3-deoxy-7-phosphoheptulonate synthase